MLDHSNIKLNLLPHLTLMPSAVTPQLTIEQQFNSTYAAVSQQVQATDKFAAVTHQSHSSWACNCYAAVTQHLYYSYTAFAGAL
ncbi:unnamed protein product [Caenorhabditis brenneri]